MLVSNIFCRLQVVFGGVWWSLVVWTVLQSLKDLRQSLVVSRVLCWSHWSPVLPSCLCWYLLSAVISSGVQYSEWSLLVLSGLCWLLVISISVFQSGRVWVYRSQMVSDGLWWCLLISSSISWGSIYLC